MLILAADAGASLGGEVPQGRRLLALTLGNGEVGAVMGEPFRFAGEVAAVALFAAVGALGRGADALGAGGETIEQFVDGGVEHASIGAIELRAFEIERSGKALPGGAGEKTAIAEEGRTCVLELGGVWHFAGALFDQRGEGDDRPMHFGKTVELGGELAVAGQLRVVRDPRRLEQIGKHGGGRVAHEIAHGPCDGLCQFARLGSGHDGDQLVGQGCSKQRVGVGAVRVLRPFALREAVGVDADFVAQPQVDQRHAAQLREDHRVRSEPLADHLEALPGDARQQVRASPQVGGGAGLGDEVLHRAEAHRQQRGVGAFIGGKRRRKGCRQVEVGPDRVVGNARVGRQQLPECAQTVGVDLRAEAPEG